uniref:Alpha-2-macroglobulin domain-containing protein n=1 Tax=Magallana gigas TaxID=29159 RepID=K1Q5A4_MAGGI
MSYGVTRARVASNITLQVTTPQSNSYVALVAIDKGSELLGAPNDITETEVISGLGMYSMGGAVERPTDAFNQMAVDRRKRSSFFWPRIYTTFHLLQSVGVLWMTDAIVEGENINFHMQQEVVHDMGKQPNIPIEKPAENVVSDFSGSAPSSDQQVRKYFPETFIWMDGQSGADSIFEVRTKLPDSITSWVTRAIVVSPSSGLHVPDVTQIESFKPFFLVVETPPSIIQGEVFEVKVLLFNYIETGPEEVQATVSIRGKVDNTAKVWSKELESEPTSSDGVSKTLTPEGRRIEMTKVISLEASGSTDIPPVEVSFPPSAVKGSKAVYALVMGDMLGQALSNPEKMITVPTGCGEQNMATTVPNIYLLQHLRATETVTTLESKIIQNIKIGYQKELKYMRNDGSYSAFGMNDPSGSTWLTAFVLKSFAEIHRMLPDLVDPNIIVMATSWLNGQVDDRGSVLEPGRVIHTEMQGTMSDSKEKLAAFVLACYAEVLDVFRGSKTELIFIMAQTKMTAIEKLLKGNLPRAVTDPYYSSLLAYALALDGSSTLEVELLTQQLMDNATSYMEGAVEMKCLGKDCGGQGNEEKRPNPMMRMYTVHEPSPSSIEMTGYLLLTLMTSNKSTEALPFLRWLNSKRNSLGGWYSTQDTVVGLKALSEFARSRMDKNKNVQINVDVIAKENSTVLKTKSFQINQNNRILLQREQFPVETTHVEIKPSQAGDAVVTVVWHYNLVESLVDENIQVTVQKQPISNQIYDINACVQYLGSEPSNMALVTVTLGSGMVPDLNQLNRNPGLAKVEVEGSQVHMYINERYQLLCRTTPPLPAE